MIKVDGTVFGIEIQNVWHANFFVMFLFYIIYGSVYGTVIEFAWDSRIAEVMGVVLVDLLYLTLISI